ncbi:ABC transporter ATP-binding protein [Paenibacillus pectinilyticus]|uniref:ABC transporter ATP-binding protein n=1 Tax=Paenibacillus pectinilyticus TaxID=512399 RepID=A0A1C1A7E3_9BACL|nr:ABC transporter ATP-binding protein [Paenibacillus pectinilyticus]
MVALCPTYVALADNTVLQNQAVDGGVINQNITFIDLSSDHWAYQAISDMNKRGFINGYDDKSFKPANPITRQEFAKLIATSFYLDLPSQTAATFADVQSDLWSYKYVEAAKDYLTGYYPPKGKAFFSPDTNATREDVAVALVKVLGFTQKDLQDPDILSYKFRDIDQISYNLRDYVAIATEKSLINGYDDGTFRPEQPITRAEVASLLYRCIKSSSGDQTNGPTLKASVPVNTTDGTYYVSGQTDKNAKVMINDEEAQVDENGQFREGFKLDKEGTYNIVITAKWSNGKSNSITKKIKFEMPGPTLTVDDLPDTTDINTVSVSGSVQDENGRTPTVYLNDKKISTGYSYFSATANLVEGENTLVFKATNSNGKTTTITKQITYSDNGPSLKIDDIPDTTSLSTVSVSGTVQDKNDDQPIVQLNNVKISNGYSYFSKTVDLQEGENILVFKAINKLGKVTTITKRITWTAGGPALKIDDLPEVVTNQSLSVSGTVSDKNDSNPIVRLNNEKISNGYSYFSKTITLKEGANTLVFEATNSVGKKTTITKTVTLKVNGPVLRVNDLPDSVTKSSLDVSGTVSDINDSFPVVYLNNVKISNGYSYFSKTITLQLGANDLVFKATNSIGGTTTVTKSVYYGN